MVQIENNEISYSTCVGITLGKYGDQWDNTSQDTAEGYVETIWRALEMDGQGKTSGAIL
jgi:alpha-L-arabinofuranosidase